MENSITLVQSSLVLTPEGSQTREEVLAVESPYTVSLNEVDIGTAMVLETSSFTELTPIFFSISFTSGCRGPI